MDRRDSLPHGAKGIESDDFAVAFGGDKIVFAPKGAGDGMHYTLHTGPDSGVIDLHETHPSGRKERRTLFALRLDDLPAVFDALAAMPFELMRLIRPLRLGWLKHRNIGIARGIELVSDADISAVTRRRKRRLILDAGLYERNIHVPDYLDGVYDFPGRKLLSIPRPPQHRHRLQEDGYPRPCSTLLDQAPRPDPLCACVGTADRKRPGPHRHPAR